MILISPKLNLVWVLFAFARIATPEQVGWAWKVAGCFIPISMGWAAGDVSLAAYIQSLLSESAFRGFSIHDHLYTDPQFYQIMNVSLLSAQ